MITPQIHINAHPKAVITSYSNSNAITKDYYYFLVGEINRGTMKKAVCRVEYLEYGNYTTYHLISI